MLNLFRKKKNLFIHIPKTGGSSFVGLLKESFNLSALEMQTPSHVISSVRNTEVSHVDFETQERKFKRPDIFDSKKNSSLKKKYEIFMIVRHPVDRVISEFNFQFHILGGKLGNKSAGIIDRLPNPPDNIDDYILNPHVQNYQVKFLLGRKLADPKPLSEEEFQLVLKAIKELPIHCGVTDKYSDFLNLFQEKSNIKLNSQFVVRKKTPESAKSKVNAKTKAAIERLNDFDLRLYTFVKENMKSNLSKDYFNCQATNDFTI